MFKQGLTISEQATVLHASVNNKGAAILFIWEFLKHGPFFVWAPHYEFYRIGPLAVSGWYDGPYGSYRGLKPFHTKD